VRLPPTSVEPGAVRRLRPGAAAASPGTLAAAWRPRRTRRHRTCRPSRTRAVGRQGPCRVRARGGSDAAVEDLALDLLDRLRDGDAAGARLGAVVGRAAAPHAVEVVHHRQALGGALVARV